MNIDMKHIVRVSVIATTLLLNVACLSATSSDVWSNADYSSGSVNPAPKVIKSASGFGILN